MIDATPQGSYRTQQGSKAVRVGIIDTGVDASHPDIAPNFDFALSRNFTTDKPDIDGPCADGRDAARTRRPSTRAATARTSPAPSARRSTASASPASPRRSTSSTSAAARTRATSSCSRRVDALTYAGDHGIDVVNMSYYIDPWLYNCAANPADSPAEQAEQRTIIAATQRALSYARDRGVSLVAAEGNGHTDLGKPTVDDTSPDYPVAADGNPTQAHHRDIDNSCISMPTEGKGVIGVTSVGPSQRKAYYSDYGLEQADVSAPGGDSRDDPRAARRTGTIPSRVLSTYPARRARRGADRRPGTRRPPSLIRP